MSADAMRATVLAVLAEPAGAEACLDAAAAAAAAVPRAVLAALHVRVDPETTIMPSEEILPPRRREALQLEAAGEAAALQAQFLDWRARQPPGLAAAWQDVAGGVATEVARIGQAARLLVMAAPGPQSRGHAHAAFHAALFATGRPLLRVPPAGPAHPPRRIAIGWKDSAVCRRAVTEAAPWLRQAVAVDVLHAVARDAAELDAAAALLAQLGVTAALHGLTRGAAPVGEQLLAEAAARAADWLVIGAWQHSRLTELLLGGVTRVVLGTAKLSVFLMH